MWINLGAGGEDAAGWDCFWVDDRTAADSSGQCLLIDDQFALIPAQFAAAYFTTSTEIQPKHKHFSIPQFDEDGELFLKLYQNRCMCYGVALHTGAHDDPRLDTWETCDKQLQAKQPTQPSTVYGQGIRAEVELTCRLLAHEAQLGLLRVRLLTGVHVLFHSMDQEFSLVGLFAACRFLGGCSETDNGGAVAQESRQSGSLQRGCLLPGSRLALTQAEYAILIDATNLKHGNGACGIGFSFFLCAMLTLSLLRRAEMEEGKPGDPGCRRIRSSR
eukprot:COSAG06_NODE_8698_length_2094_cov_1.538346_1_plen_274_part_00